MRFVLVLLVSFMLLGCGGSSPQSDGSENSLSLADGVWYGVQTIDNVSYETGVLIYGGKLYGFSADADVLFSGEGSVQEGKLRSAYVLYDMQSGIKIADGTIQGSIAPKSAIDAVFENTLGIKGSLALKYDEINRYGASIDQVSGSFVNYAGVEFDIDSTGTISGLMGQCDMGGSIAAPQNDINIYTITLQLTNCPVSQYNGVYEGLGVYDPAQRGLIVTFSDGETMGLFSAIKR